MNLPYGRNHPAYLKFVVSLSFAIASMTYSETYQSRIKQPHIQERARTMSLLIPLQNFAEAVTAKMSGMTLGEPEEQLRGPFENLMRETGMALGWDILAAGEVHLEHRLGKPDFAILLEKLLSGYMELKAPGTGADPARFRGHNKEQWERFKSLPNLLYCDGNQWALYRDGERTGALVRLSGDVARDGKKAATEEDALAVEKLLRDFLSWQPVIPRDTNGKVDLRAFAGVLAPLCRLLRDDVLDAARTEGSPLKAMAKDCRGLLFPEANDPQFADAYAQTVTFALLLGRCEGAEPLTPENAVQRLSVQHTLLSKALQLLTDPNARKDISASVDMLLRVIAAIPPSSLSGPRDPWLYFYEDFLAAYDPALRKDAGAYYTPVEVVRAQVRLINGLLTERLQIPFGFAGDGVVTLDPSVGTGTYLLAVIDHATGEIERKEGQGAVPGHATALAENLHGFEIMTGPYAVCELRVSRALADKGAVLPKEGTRVFLTDTLESPHAAQSDTPLFFRPIADQRKQALKIKRDVPVIVCLGNPPYDRHAAARTGNKAQTGGWVRWGEDGKGAAAILRDFSDPVKRSGRGGGLKNLYNLYVYFWRWALWKVFERDNLDGPGIVSFITASSYLDGGAFCGMREHIRRMCDEIWILDIGGEGRGARKDDNVFAIQTPVAVAVLFRSGRAEREKPAKVRYVKIEGTRAEKLAALDAVTGFASVAWEECPQEWQAPFRPEGKGMFFDWPLLTDLMPWQHSGVQLKRTWPVCHDKNTLKIRWNMLLHSQNRVNAFKETRDRKIASSYPSFSGLKKKSPLSETQKDAAAPPILRYPYRSFDRQWFFADSRIGDYLRPGLWLAYNPQQIYIAGLFSHPLGSGPALTVASTPPDLHFFSGRGAKDIIPLYLNSTAQTPNILPGLLEVLSREYGRGVNPEEFAAYVYGVLAQPAYTRRFAKELENREVRVPLTQNAALFEKAAKAGTRLLWLHTYGERFVPEGATPRQVPGGRARCEKPVPGAEDGYPETFHYREADETLVVGQGEFRPVSPRVYTFEISGLKVVQSWLGYRMKKGAGKKSSPLDDIRPARWTSQFTTELLELLWVLEATVEGYPEQEKILKEIVSGPCFGASGLPPVPPRSRRPPREAADPGSLFEGILEDA
jgi:hypothetical protein